MILRNKRHVLNHQVTWSHVIELVTGHQTHHVFYHVIELVTGHQTHHVFYHVISHETRYNLDGQEVR